MIVMTTTRPQDPPTEPPEDPPTCSCCKWFFDIGVPRVRKPGGMWWEILVDGGACVRKFDVTGDYDDLTYVDCGQDACDGYEGE